ncbi:MAG: hypothetical protein ACE5JS_20080 [Nitrospinota bacterium]
MKVTPFKAKANRKNAQKSTGPKTVKGKAAVRYNALKHGILAKEVVIPNGEGKERQEDFDALLADLCKDLQPEGAMEEMLVEKIGVCHWRLARVLRCEIGEIRTNLNAARWEALSDRVNDVNRDKRDLAFSDSAKQRLMGTSLGLSYLIDVLEETQEEVEEEGLLSKEAWNKLVEHFEAEPVCVPRNDGRAEWRSFVRELGDVADEKDGRRKILRLIGEEKKRLKAFQDVAAENESLQIEAEIAGHALPDPETTDKLVRYERMLNRELYRAMRQLERLQRRRQGEAVPPPISIGS